jgi:hypothetical protein
VSNTPSNKAAFSRYFGLLVTVLVSLTAAVLVVKQLARKPDSDGEPRLQDLDRRAAVLRKITDPVQRDGLCVPLSAYGRALDRALPRDSRVFLSGMVGKTNGGKLGYFYFLRNYLFPRDVEISLDAKPLFKGEWYEGVPCDSAAQLQTNGFDLFIRLGQNDAFQLIPLTTNGIPK